MMRTAKLILTVLLGLSFALIGGACGKDGEIVKPAPPSTVNSIWITYNDIPVYGVLSVDKSLESITLDANISVSGSPNYSLKFSSDNEEIASISDKTLTLHKAGEAVITATAGDAEHKIVLVVGDDSSVAPSSYSIVVVGGTSSLSSACEGDYVTITATEPAAGSVFKEWQWDASIEWKNGNVFRMPAGGVTITAVYEYFDVFTINVIGGTASKIEAIEGDYVTLVSEPAPEHFEFKGWAFDVEGVLIENNVFKMPASNITVTAVYEQYEFLVTVAGGFADVTYAEVGDIITLTANQDTETHFFTGWVSDTEDVTIADNTFSMPARDVVITAIFEEREIILGMTLNKSELLLLLDEEEALVAEVESYGGVDDRIIWSVVSETDLEGNPLTSGSVITLGQYGEVVGVGAGKATVRVQTVNPLFPFSEECEITVANLRLFGGTVAGVDYVGTTYDEYSESNGYLYSITSGETLTLVADTAPDGRIFVGWDIGSEGYRLGQPGEQEYTFVMTGEAYTIWSVFSEYKDLFNTGALDRNAVSGGALFAAHSGKQFGYPSNNSAAQTITGGNGDPALEGMNGIVLGIPSDTNAGVHNRIRGSVLSNIDVKGSVTITYIFKNHSPNFDLTIEIMGESYGAVATSGYVTIPKNSVVKKTITVPHGFHNPYLIFVVRNAVGGDGTERIRLDIVARQAPTYMKFDPVLPTEGVVQLKDYSPKAGGSETLALDNAHGLTLQASDIGTGNRSALINNLPQLLEGETNTRVYFRITNYQTTVESTDLTLKFGSALNSSDFGQQTVTLLKNTNGNDGTELLFWMDIDRSTTPTDVYFTFSWEGKVFRCFSIQMSYFNVYDVE